MVRNFPLAWLVWADFAPNCSIPSSQQLTRMKIYILVKTCNRLGNDWNKLFQLDDLKSETEMVVLNSKVACNHLYLSSLSTFVFPHSAHVPPTLLGVCWTPCKTWITTAVGYSRPVLHVSPSNHLRLCIDALHVDYGFRWRFRSQNCLRSVGFQFTEPVCIFGFGFTYWPIRSRL